MELGIWRFWNLSCFFFAVVCRRFIRIFVSHVPHFHTIPTIFKWIHGRSNIKQSKFVFVIDLTTLVVIDDITNIFTTSINDPIMAIKGQFIAEMNKKVRSEQQIWWQRMKLPHPITNSSPWTVLCCFTTKTFQFRVPTFFGVQCFPFKYF